MALSEVGKVRYSTWCRQFSKYSHPSSRNFKSNPSASFSVSSSAILVLNSTIVTSLVRSFIKIAVGEGQSIGSSFRNFDFVTGMMREMA